MHFAIPTVQNSHGSAFRILQSGLGLRTKDQIEVFGMVRIRERVRVRARARYMARDGLGLRLGLELGLGLAKGKG